ncbi:hypothetical protein [Bacillus cereus]|uniref:Uncharacterized protein n=1 Tax=Bacillus cereus TaxID=1396 RepID=A0A161T964_BACCE|nr:hypothetical protein [Bacillus cereus]KZD70961.1 hypothetical protein B4088_1017 [Bacillus cereus]
MKKEVTLYLRANEGKKIRDTVLRYMGCLLMEYKGNQKYIFFEEIKETSHSRVMLHLLENALQMLKEPCTVKVVALAPFFSLGFGYIETKEENRDLGLKITEIMREHRHTILFHYHNKLNETEEGLEIFKMFEKEFADQRKGIRMSTEY